MRRAAVLIAAAALGACLASCASDPRDGYSLRTRGVGEARTVQVPIFKNATPEPGQEVLLTEAVIKEMQRQGWRVVQSATADTTLTGTLTSSELRKLSVDPQTGYVQEMGMAVRIDFDWKDNRSGEMLIARRGFGASDTFVPQRRAAESVEQARLGAFGQVARDIVSELRGHW